MYFIPKRIIIIVTVYGFDLNVTDYPPGNCITPKKDIGGTMESVAASKEAYKRIQEKLSKDDFLIISPQGKSMFPFLIEKRDRVLVEKIKDKYPKKGDIVLYRRSNNLLVLHRLYKVTDGEYYFLGDNQTSVEGPFKPEQLIAVVRKIIRKNKTFSSHNPLYYIPGRIWLFCRPVRPFIAAVLKKIMIFFHLWK